MTTLAQPVVSHLVTNRVVWTYQPDGWPRGLITGAENEKGFFIEHVVVFPGAPRGTLAAMVRAGLAEAWTRGYRSLGFYLPDAFPLRLRLDHLAQRLGFEPYARDMGEVFYILWHP